MIALLAFVLSLLTIAAAFTWLATLVRHDHFASPRTVLRDELGLAQPFRPI